MKRQDQSKQQHQFRIWGASSELVNYFSALTDAKYTSVEIKYLLDLYEKIEHDLADDISHLLNETNAFLNATTLEPLFKESRDKTLDEQEFNKIIYKMAVAIKQIDELSKKQSNKTDSDVLTSAADYAAECVHRRVRQLKTAHDKIYDLYKNGHLEVDLRNVIQDHHHHP